MATAGDILSLAPLPVLMAAAATDVAFRLIPNCLPFGLAAFGLAERVVSGDWVPSTLFAGAVFLVLFPLWYFNKYGGGDIKFLPACILLVPFWAVGTLILAVSLAQIALCLVYLPGRLRLLRAAKPSAVPASRIGRVFRIEGWRIRRGGGVPLGCAISTGCAFILVTGIFHA